MIQDGKILPNMGLVVGIPSSRQVMPEWAIALATQPWPSNMNVAYAPIHCGNPKTGMKGPPRDKARELIVEGALQLKAPYVWMIDDDVEVPFGAIRQLLKTLKEAPEDVMAVGGIYPTKTSPAEPVVYKTNGHGAFWKWKKDTIFECALVGTGCMLIKTEVFQHLEKPWFKDIDTANLQVTDDAWFCGKLELAGFKVLADGHVICTHWDNETMTPYRLADDSYPMIPVGKEALFSNLPKGWMSTIELEWLSEQASKHNRIVELGCFLGHSTVVLAKSTAGEVWAIDDFKGPRHTVADEEVKKLLAEGPILDRFKENVESLPNVFWIQTDHADFSTLPPEWLRGQPEEKPDMVFIDGSHQYEDVKRDILAWKQRLRPGGLLCGHDFDWPGVRQAIDELLPGWKPEAGVIWSAA